MSTTPEHRTLAEARKQSQLANEYFARATVELEDAEQRLETGLKEATNGILDGLVPTALDRLHRSVANARTVHEVAADAVDQGRADEVAAERAAHAERVRKRQRQYQRKAAWSRQEFIRRAGESNRLHRSRRRRHQIFPAGGKKTT